MRRACLFVAVMSVVATPSAIASNGHGPKVDDRVALAASIASSDSALPVIVFGKQVNSKNDPALTVKSDVALAVSGTVPAGRLDELAAAPNVAYIAPDVAMAPLGKGGGGNALTGLSFPALQALFPATDNAPAAWARGLTGAGVGIAVIDSGIQANDDYGRSSRVKVQLGFDHGDDGVGHGSLVTHIAAGASPDGRFVGIAPGANVVVYNVASKTGTYTSDVLQALIWVVSNQQAYNIRVVNLSLAETTPSFASQSVLDTFIDAIANYYNIAIVTSSGNLGADSMVFAPGNDPFAITVGATDTNGTVDPADDTVTPWSSRGLTYDGVSKPDLVAPGRQIVGALPYGTTLGKQAPAANWVVANGYASSSGTSFSAPQVTGAAAILFQEHPDWTPGQVKWVLVNTARVTADGSLALDVDAATKYLGIPPSSYSGLAVSSFGMPDWVQTLLNGSSGFQGNGWNNASWNRSSWQGNGWNGNGWNTDGWQGNGWNSTGWNDHGFDE